MKTTHQLARELLALPDIPVFHFDPSFADACTDDDDKTVGTPSVEVQDTEPNEVGAQMRYATIVGDQPEEDDRQPSE